MLVLGIIAGSSYEEKIQIPNNGRRIPAVLTKMMYLCLAKEKTSIIILSCLAWNVGKINVLTSSSIWNIFADPCNSYRVSTLFFKSDPSSNDTFMSSILHHILFIVSTIIPNFLCMSSPPHTLLPLIVMHPFNCHLLRMITSFR